MALRPYQHQAITDLRGKLNLYFKKVFYQLATGAGKTVIFSEITRLAQIKNMRVWIIVPRRKLLRQASKHLTAIRIPHGVISAISKESRAYMVHVVSLQTLTRRIANNKIKNWPDIIIFDEGHTNLDQQVKIQNIAPTKTIFIGVSATPERADGRGLCEAYEDIVYGPDFSWLVEHDYLSRIHYFCPPFDFKVKKRGDDYDPKTIEEILASRQIYGKVISHYKDMPQGQTLVFCPSVKNAETTAQRFRDSGFKFESIDGRMTDNQLDVHLNALEAGQLDGITSCDIVTYGLDISSISNIIMLRKTMSRALFFQIIGRGTRPETGKVLTVNDHVGNFRELATGEAGPDDPVEKCFDVEWNFDGLTKNKKAKGEVVASLKLCQNCYMYYCGPSCPHCGVARDAKKPINYEEIDGRLIEVKGPIKLNDRPREDRREYQDKYNGLLDKIKDCEPDMSMDKYVRELIELAESAGYKNPMVIYWQISREMLSVNVPLLHSIRRVKSYKHGWLHMKTNEISDKLGR